uniref:U6 snRNA-associated Sm-like protein LSm4 n=1 Tax=Babesia bovis TaxID=5865 RepID=A7AWX9_BABBO|eukprot:XP_001609125.1 U6 snRNA-associated Sm-like protein LSm4 [Babesia bovis T2Bo]
MTISTKFITFGETYSGILSSCDAFMNVHMINAICTSKKGDEFWKLSECFIRGNNVKSFRFPDEVATVALEESKAMVQENMNINGPDRGASRGRRPHQGRGQLKH